MITKHGEHGVGYYSSRDYREAVAELCAELRMTRGYVTRIKPKKGEYQEIQVPDGEKVNGHCRYATAYLVETTDGKTLVDRMGCTYTMVQQQSGEHEGRWKIVIGY